MLLDKADVENDRKIADHVVRMHRLVFLNLRAFRDRRYPIYLFLILDLTYLGYLGSSSRYAR